MAQDNDDATNKNTKRKRKRTDDDGNDGENTDDNGDDDNIVQSQESATMVPAASSSNNNSSGSGLYRKGAIRRIELRNFMTYKHGIFEAGPALNVVIGPNGTGKSSIVSAILLGLTGKPSSLMRADKVGDFVKTGESSASIEITLAHAAENGNDDVKIRRVIKLNHTSVWYRDGKKCSLEKVKELVESLKIRVDNLCVFLAQERVVSFAKLSPSELLQRAEEAADPELLKLHEQLMNDRKRQMNFEHECELERVELQKAKDRHKELQKHMQRFEERKSLDEKIEWLDKKLLWTIFARDREEALKLREQSNTLEKEMEEARKVVEPLRERVDVIRARCNEIENDMLRAQKDVDCVDRDKETTHSNFERLQSDYDDLRSDLENLETQAEETRSKINNFEKKRATLEGRLEDMPDVSQMEAEFDRLKAEERAIRDEIDPLSSERVQKEQDLRKVKRQVDRLEHDMEKLRDVKVMRMQRLNKQFRGSVRRVYDYVKGNPNEFRGDVIGPLFNEINVKDESLVHFVETAVPVDTLLGYVCTDPEDTTMLSRKFKKEKCTFMNVQSGGGSGMYDVQALHNAGFDQLHTMDSLIEAPELVMRGLRDMHRIGETVVNVSKKALTPDELERVLSSRVQDGKVMNLMDVDVQHTVRFSAYGGDQSINVSYYRPTNILQSTNQEEVDALVADIEQFKTQMGEVSAQLSAVAQQADAKNAQLHEVCQQKKQYDTRKTKRAIKKLHDDIRNCGRQIKQLERNLDVSGERDRITSALKKTNNDRVTTMRKLVALFGKWLVACRCKDAAHISNMVVMNCAQEAEMAFRHAEEAVIEKQDAWTRAKRVFLEAKKKAALSNKKAKEKAPAEECAEKFKESWMPNTVKEIEDLRLEYDVKRNHWVIDEGAVVECRELEKKMEELEEKALSCEERLKAMEDELVELQQSYLPRLERMVETINESFSEYFRQMGCTGQVVLHRDADYSKFELQIRVSYREDGRVKVLSSMTQSGGERSVATMLFLLSLQNVTDTPFRVVDEINQGMDATNERMIFNRIVGSSDGDNQPQYFMVTPKLLSNLEYSPRVRVAAVFNGPWIMPQDDWSLPNFLENRQ